MRRTGARRRGGCEVYMAIMSAGERAAQIWAVLALAARNRQILTYEIVGRLIGVPARGLGHLLEPIQSYCLVKGLPPLTILVVQEGTFFFFNDTATTEIYTLSLHDALPI